MKGKLFAITMAAVLLLAGCGGGTAGGAAADMPASGAPQSTAGGTENGYWDMGTGGGESYYPEEPGAPMESDNQGGSIYQNPRAKLIRRAELSIQTEQFDESAEALKKLTADCGGYFENANLYGGTLTPAAGGNTPSGCRRRSTTYFCRVPGSWAM